MGGITLGKTATADRGYFLPIIPSFSVINHHHRGKIHGMSLNSEQGGKSSDPYQLSSALVLLLLHLSKVWL